MNSFILSVTSLKLHFIWDILPRILRDKLFLSDFFGTSDLMILLNFRQGLE